MKKNTVLFLICLAGSTVRSQEVFTVLPGTDVFFGTGTVVSSNDLTLIPSSGFSMNGTALSKNIALLHSSLNLSVSRAYTFSSPVLNFSGSVQIRYQDAELNGIMEPALRLNIHNGTGWQSFATSVNDGTANTVLTSSITGLTLSELSLADVALTLPLQWNDINAYRVAQTVKVSWKTENENNISHFNVQRSGDSHIWVNIATDVRAINKTAQKYEVTDYDYKKQHLFYRIKQSGNNGNIAYSRLIPVVAESGKSAVTIFPNPVSGKFSLSGDLSSVTKIDLYSATGTLIKSWKNLSASYDIHELPPGSYVIRLGKKDDAPQTIKISKQ